MPARASRQRADGFGTELTIDPDHDISILRITGELDLDNTVDLRDALVAAVDSGCSRIVADLTRVAFIGSRSLGTLVVTAHRAKDRGSQLHVVAAHPAVVRAMEISGLAAFLRLTSTTEDIVPGAAAVDSA